MENLNPLGVEGDKHFIQLNMTTLDKAGEEPPAPEPVAEQPVVEAEDSTADELEDDAEPEEQTDGD
jgi:hypothetical protein